RAVLLLVLTRLALLARLLPVGALPAGEATAGATETAAGAEAVPTRPVAETSHPVVPVAVVAVVDHRDDRGAAGAADQQGGHPDREHRAEGEGPVAQARRGGSGRSGRSRLRRLVRGLVKGLVLCHG